MGNLSDVGRIFYGIAEAKSNEKISFIVFYTLQFPLGLLFGLLTGNFDNGIFAALLNPFLIAWTLQKFFIKTKRSIRRTFQINYIIWGAMVLTIIVYIATE